MSVIQQSLSAPTMPGSAKVTPVSSGQQRAGERFCGTYVFTCVEKAADKLVAITTFSWGCLLS